MKKDSCYVFKYYLKYYPTWFLSMSHNEFIKLFKIYQTKIKKLSDLPKEASWFR